MRAILSLWPGTPIPIVLRGSENLCGMSGSKQLPRATAEVGGAPLKPCSCNPLTRFASVRFFFG